MAKVELNLEDVLFNIIKKYIDDEYSDENKFYDYSKSLDDYSLQDLADSMGWNKRLTKPILAWYQKKFKVWAEQQKLEQKNEAAKRQEVINQLCAILSSVENDKNNDNGLDRLLNQIDWREAGVKRKAIIEWWKGHKQKDAMRKQYEHEKREREKYVKRLKKEALAKLSDEEKKVLGVK